MLLFVAGRDKSFLESDDHVMQQLWKRLPHCARLLPVALSPKDGIDCQLLQLMTSLAPQSVSNRAILAAFNQLHNIAFAHLIRA